MKIATCQMLDVQGDLERSLSEMQMLAEKADLYEVELLCFPEGYLQGYTRNEAEACQRALDLSSPEFNQVLERIASCKPVLIFGVIEFDQNKLFNTAVVIDRGRLIGFYRKTYPNEKIYQAGIAYPIFDVDGHKFGINICNDANFEDAAKRLVDQGATIIVYPLNNMLPKNVAERWRSRHIENLFRRARQTGAWIVSADVVGERMDSIGYGCTAIVDPNGNLIEKVSELNTGMIMAEIPKTRDR